jgi:hypothetical protein
MTEQELKIEVRLAAHEYVLSHILSKIHILTGISREQIAASNQNIVERLSLASLPGAEAVQADMVLDEFAAVVTNLLNEALEMSEAAKAAAKRPG